jgi:hypothetical protein
MDLLVKSLGIRLDLGRNREDEEKLQIGMDKVAG